VKSTILENVACTVCGCVCDDLRITTDGERITRAERACALAEPWLLSQRASTKADDSWKSKLDTAAAILNASRSPLIYGLSRSTTEGQRAAVALADKIGGTIDTTASTGHAPSIMALQQVGESTCTLGEVKQRADLVIFWGSDPAVTHPRHIERYCPPRAGRTIIVVDVEETATAKQADAFIRIEPGKDWEALWKLRMLIQKAGGHRPPDQAGQGDDVSPLSELAERMLASKFGIVFFGAGITKGSLAHRTIEALLQLVTDLNDHTDAGTRRRFYARRMRRYGDVAGADSVLAWQTGYPFGVNFAAGYPRYNPGEFTGPDMLARKEVDACVLVGGDTIKDFPAEALDHLRNIPVILLDSPEHVPLIPPTISFETAVYGVHRLGTAYRMDEVPIPLRVLLKSDLPSDAEVLEGLLTRCHRTA
jgi:formylmethanofuran dehydrogenase subunit B